MAVYRVTDHVSLDQQLAASRRSAWPGIGTMRVDQQPGRLTKIGRLVDAAVHVNKLIASRIARAAIGAASGRATWSIWSARGQCCVPIMMVSLCEADGAWTRPIRLMDQLPEYASIPVDTN